MNRPKIGQKYNVKLKEINIKLIIIKGYQILTQN